MCGWGDTIEMRLVVPARLSHDGKIYRRAVAIDRCIAPLVAALNNAGIRTVASCCGHGKGMGNIALDGGRELIIRPACICGHLWSDHFDSGECSAACHCTEYTMEALGL